MTRWEPTDGAEEEVEEGLRRRRLAEVLLLSVIHAPDDAPVRRTACALEHALDPAITQAVCAFLGHPRACPHGKPIAPGECCRTATQPSRPLIQPLSELPPGSDADVVYLAAPDPGRLTRLASLGVAPGARLHLMQTAPAVVIRVGNTTIAFEKDLASEVYVRVSASVTG